MLRLELVEPLRNLEATPGFFPTQRQRQQKNMSLICKSPHLRLDSLDSPCRHYYSGVIVNSRLVSLTVTYHQPKASTPFQARAGQCCVVSTNFHCHRSSSAVTRVYTFSVVTAQVLKSPTTPLSEHSHGCERTSERGNPNISTGFCAKV